MLPSSGGGACFHQISMIQANLQTTTNDVMDVCKLSVLVGLTYSLELSREDKTTKVGVGNI